MHTLSSSVLQPALGAVRARLFDPAAAAASAGAAAGGPRPYLLMPLNELMDEHYAVYMCKPATAAAAARPPGFCK